MKVDASHRAYQVRALVRCAMLAEENETSGLDWKGTAEVLGVAEDLLDKIIEQIETLERAKA